MWIYLHHRGFFMYTDQQQYFERSDKWNYRLLLQELYRDCILSSHDSYAFMNHVQKLNITVCNFPGLDIRDMINKLMSPYYKKSFDALVARTIKYKTNHSTQAIAENVRFQLDVHDIKYKYYCHLFDTLRDVLALHGAFNLSKAEKSHGYELQY